jgi:quercetin dioxygenase-like cupin family protein
VSAGRAVPAVQVDDASVRVTEWRFAPGAATGWHRHEHPYVVVPMTTGRLEVVAREGTSLAELRCGQAYARPAGVEHDVRNANAFEFVFVEVEWKRG